VHIDWRMLGYAVEVEAVLAGLAMLGGPHGMLGAWPWTLQLPGILLVFFGGEGGHIVWRIGGMLLVQCALWYGILILARRLTRRGTA
jgi:hypothetical protein